jgi:hypothetical protein
MVTQAIQKWQRFARCKEARHLPRVTRLINAEARCFGAIQIRVKSVPVDPRRTPILQGHARADAPERLT